MTDNELLLAISNIMDQKIQPLYKDMQDLKEEVATLKKEVAIIKENLQKLTERVQQLENRVTNIELTLENETNHSIQLVAENHMNLVDKLNQAIRVSDKTLLYEVQVSNLKSKVEHLEKEIAEIKNRIA